MAADGLLRVDSTELELGGVASTAGNDGLDISKLLTETGHVTFDPGFGNTASLKSAITFIDGDEGILRYRGYAIDSLAENASFVEVAYLLIKGELPSDEQLKEFEKRIGGHVEIPEAIYDIVGAMPEDAHPMTILSTAVSALGAFNQDTIDVFDDEQMEEAAVRLLGAMPALTALAHRRRFGGDIVRPEPQYGLVGNFVRSNFAESAESWEDNEQSRRAMDVLFTLHGDHEQNCSTSSVRLVGSAEANLFQSVVAGVNALAGPLHGGANSAVLEMLEEISASDDGAETYMERVKNKERGVRLMGFGHRVYKNYDPRATIIKKYAHSIIEEIGGGDDDLLDLATSLERVALEDDYFVSRKLYPNVDFYTGLIYKALGFPTDMFTVIFAMGRMPGWIAQWIEMRKDETTRIGRPRQIYTGEQLREFPSK